MKALALLGLAALRSLWLMLSVRPAVVLAMGGYVSAPVGVAAFLCRRPLVVHEQNAIPGMTNRVLARLATSVLEAVAGSFPPARAARHVGNPVRPDIAALAGRPDCEKAPDAPLSVLVFGGSQGAASLNRHVPRALATVAAGRRLTVTHQAGADAVDEVRAAYAALGIEAEVCPFINDMSGAYAAADVVIARAGAMSLAEILVAGVPAILVPYPYAVDDHQRANAAAAVAAGAAVMVDDAALGAPEFADELTRLADDAGLRAQMRAAAHAIAMPDAARQVADVLIDIAGQGGCNHNDSGHRGEVDHV